MFIMRIVKIFFALILIAIFFAGCGVDSIDLSDHTNLQTKINQSLLNKIKLDKTRLWHLKENSEWKLIEINDNSVQKHLNHGDKYIAVGDVLGGGVVFYIDPYLKQGQHGLIVSLEDQGLAEWGCYLKNISGTKKGIGHGFNNTRLILENCSEEEIAAVLASNYRGGGFSDWFLPSIGELNELLYSDIYINPILKQNGGLPVEFIPEYWSSSQYDNNRDELKDLAWNALSTSIFEVPTEKFYNLRVRAIRAF